jgi:subfamily B ATP-binding cassette protein HlyB/CyaB
MEEQTMTEKENVTNTIAGKICLAVVAKGFGIPIDEEKMVKEYGIVEDLIEPKDFIKAAKKIKLTAKVIKSGKMRLPTIPVPAIAIMNNGDYVVIGENNSKKIVLFAPMYGHSIIMPLDEFFVNWTGQVIIFKRAFNLKDISRQFNLTWFIPVVVRYKRYFIEILGAAFFFQLFGLVAPLCTQVIIDKVIINHGTVTLNMLVIGMVLVVLFQTVMNLIRTYLFTHTTNKIDVILGTRMFRLLMHLPIQFFETRRVGDTLMRVSALNNIREFLTGTAVTVLIDLSFSIVFFAVMFYYSVSLTLIAIVAIPIQLAINMLGTPMYQKRLQDSWNASAENNAFVVEAITGIHTVKSLAVEPQFNFRWEKLLARSVSTNLDKAQFSVVLNNGGSLIQKLVTYLIIWFGGFMVIDGSVTIGQFIAFQMMANQAGAPLLRLVGMWQSFQQTKLAVTRIGDILNAVPELTSLPDAIRLPEIKGEIKLENITFRYHIENDEVLRQINLHIKPGMKVGIVGRSGSGKSTLTKIIQRLYIPEAGRVYIDNVDIAQVDPAWLRQQIGAVLQDNYLFNGSVRENITLARQGASMKEINRVAKLAGAHDFILELPEGYDTIVGERGAALSGGQCQRIAIARALISDPKIVIFDEATSALDYQSERIIMGNIEQIAAGRTMIIVAHRLANVKKCDVIIVMERGQIIEQGTHDNLMGQRGVYYNLYQQQGDSHV